jgi:predicted DNA-binding protein
MSTERLLEPKNVRLPAMLDARLTRLAKSFSLTKSDLIRQALAIQLPEWEQRGITLTATNIKEVHG